MLLTQAEILEILFHLLSGLTFSLSCIFEKSMLSSRQSAAGREKLYLKNPKRRQEKYSAASAMQHLSSVQK